MPGVFGLRAYYEDWVNSTSRFIGYGLIGLQHRGQESFGIVTAYDSKFKVYKCQKQARDAFDERKLGRIPGCVGIGAVSIYKEKNRKNVQPIIENGLALAYDGRFQLEDGAREFARMLGKELERNQPEQAGANAIEKVSGGYAFCALTKDGTIIFGRDKRGVKPLSHVGLGFDNGLVSSETCAFNVVGSKSPPQYVEPGECYAISSYSKKKCKVETNDRKLCAFECVYLANILSKLDGFAISAVRRRIGKRLAEKYPVSADIVVGVPETARPFALAYSNATGIPVEEGFARILGERSAIKPTQFEREVGVQLKLNPIREVIARKNVIVIDDSVVRGTTVRKTFKFMRDYCGVKDLHLLVGSPKIVARCPYGTEVPGEDELIARHLSDREIAEAIGADSIGFLTVEDLADCIGISLEELCTGCFTGKYQGED